MSAIGDFDGSGHGDVVVGIPGRDFSGEDAAGVTQALYGAIFADGLEGGGTSNWSSVSP